MKKILILLLLLTGLQLHANAQYSAQNAHSHNDYENDTPFRLAYNNHFGSIEADIWEVNGELFVAHSVKEIKSERTFDSLYINPIAGIVRQNKGKAWNDNALTFQLMVDLKTAAEPTLSVLVKKLEQYRDVFDPGTNENAVRIVITGNRPEPSEFKYYPDFIFFDGLLDHKYDKEQITRVPLYSANFRNYSSWNGTGDIAADEKIRLQNVIDSVHLQKKKIRFWNSPDEINAWKTFMSMGIDYINTDHIIGLAGFLNNHPSSF